MEELRNDVYNPIGKVGILNGVKVIVAPHESCAKCANWMQGCDNHKCSENDRKDNITIMYKRLT